MERGRDTTEDVVVVIDDDPLLRATLDSLFRSVGHRVACFGSTADFLREQPVPRSGCIVLDVRLPGTSGLHFQQQLTSLDIRLPVIFMTGHGDIPMSVRAMKAGALDFLAKPFRDQDMLDAVTAAIALSRRGQETEQLAAALHERLATLSPREQEVMGHVVAGQMNKVIAQELGLSEITVKIHRGNVMKKMAARSVADLVRMDATLHAHRR